MRQRLDVGRVDGHHRVEQKGEVDAFGLDGQLERLAIAIERPGSLDGGNRKGGFIGPVEQALFDAPIGRSIDDLHRPIGNRHHGNDRPDAGGVKTGERKAGDDGIEGNHFFLADLA